MAHNTFLTPSKHLLELVGCGYAALDAHGHFLETNAILATMFGYSPNILSVMDLSIIWQDEIEKTIWMKQVQVQGIVRDYAAKMKHKDGELVLVTLNAKYLQAQAVYVVCVLPAPDVARHEKQKKDLDSIVQSGGLKVSAKEGLARGDVEISAEAPFQPFFLGDLALSVMQQYEQVFEHQSRVFTYDIMKDLPACMGSKPQVLKLLSCMMDNALEATQEGESITIYVRTAMLKHKSTGLDEKYVMLSVQDNGVGMDAETQKHIFEPSFSTKLEGRGMSLARALKVIKQHDGRIHVKAGPNMGSLFKVYFPVRKDD